MKIKSKKCSEISEENGTQKRVVEVWIIHLVLPKWGDGGGRTQLVDILEFQLFMSSESVSRHLRAQNLIFKASSRARGMPHISREGFSPEHLI